MIVAIDAWDTIPEESHHYRLFDRDNLRLAREYVFDQMNYMTNNSINMNKNIHIHIGN